MLLFPRHRDPGYLGGLGLTTALKGSKSQTGDRGDLSRDSEPDAGQDLFPPRRRKTDLQHEGSAYMLTRVKRKSQWLGEKLSR